MALVLAVGGDGDAAGAGLMAKAARGSAAGLGAVGEAGGGVAGGSGGMAVMARTSPVSTAAMAAAMLLAAAALTGCGCCEAEARNRSASEAGAAEGRCRKVPGRCRKVRNSSEERVRVVSGGYGQREPGRQQAMLQGCRGHVG